MIIPAVCSELLDTIPGHSAVSGDPHCHLSPGIEGLWPAFSRSDDTPYTVTFNIERAHIVVAVRLHRRHNVPPLATPMGNGPDARIVFWSGFVSSACQIQDYRPARLIELNVFEVYVQSLLLIVAN
jgi:hypothetical protein